MIKEAMKTKDYSYKMEILAQAAKIVREETFSESYLAFDGSFSENCQQNYDPTLLKTLLSMILDGVNIKNDVGDRQELLTATEITFYNMNKSGRKGTKLYHKASQGPPLCTYIGLKLGETRNKSLIEIFNKLKFAHLIVAFCKLKMRWPGLLANNIVKMGLWPYMGQV